MFICFVPSTKQTVNKNRLISSCGLHATYNDILNVTTQNLHSHIETMKSMDVLNVMTLGSTDTRSWNIILRP
jgi:hypothetical protein